MRWIFSQIFRAILNPSIFGHLNKPKNSGSEKVVLSVRRNNHTVPRAREVTQPPQFFQCYEYFARVGVPSLRCLLRGTFGTRTVHKARSMRPHEYGSTYKVHRALGGVLSNFSPSHIFARNSDNRQPQYTSRQLFSITNVQSTWSLEYILNMLVRNQNCVSAECCFWRYTAW